jgi:DNA-binding NarL/FixJ family response regulator
VNTTRRRQLLVISEDPALAAAVARRTAGHYEVERSASAQIALSELRRRAPDVVLCDQALVPVSGEELLEIIASFFPQIRRVLYGGPTDLWRRLLSEGLVEAAVDRACGRDELLAALDA